MGKGMRHGRGGGGGRRRGMGQGRGDGQRLGRGQGAMPPSDSAPYSASCDDDQEARSLIALEKDLMAQLRAVNKRIAEFEGAERVPPVSTDDPSRCPPNKERGLVKMTAVVDNHRCIGCGFCIDICPHRAITMNDTNDIAVIDSNKCTACGSCINECPSEAISLPVMAKRFA